jgi:hypothetical protein
MVRDNPEINIHVADKTALGHAGVPDDVEAMIAVLLSDENGMNERAADRSIGRNGVLKETSHQHAE